MVLGDEDACLSFPVDALVQTRMCLDPWLLLSCPDPDGVQALATENESVVNSVLSAGSQNSPVGKGVGTIGLIVSGTLTGSHQAACELGSGSGPGKRTALWTQIPAGHHVVEKSLPKSQLRKFLPQREAQPFAP